MSNMEDRCDGRVPMGVLGDCEGKPVLLWMREDFLGGSYAGIIRGRDSDFLDFLGDYSSKYEEFNYLGLKHALVRTKNREAMREHFVPIAGIARAVILPEK